MRYVNKEMSIKEVFQDFVPLHRILQVNIKEIDIKTRVGQYYDGAANMLRSEEISKSWFGDFEEH